MLDQLLHGFCVLVLLLLFLLLSLVIIVAFAKHCISRNHYTTAQLFRRSKSWRIPAISLLLLQYLSSRRIGFIISRLLWRHTIHIIVRLLLVCTVP